MGEWQPIETAPAELWLVTCREGERYASIASTPDGEEWCATDGRTTVTHHTYLPPTHWLCVVPRVPAPPASQTDEKIIGPASPLDYLDS